MVNRKKDSGFYRGAFSLRFDGILCLSFTVMETVYRDDDISVHTDAYLFKKLNEAFIKYNKIHPTVGSASLT